MPLLSPNGPNDAFTNRVRLWAAGRALQHAQPQPLDGFIQLGREDGVAIVQQVRVFLLAAHGLSQLLPRPLPSRMRRHVKVNEPTAVMFDDDEHGLRAEIALKALVGLPNQSRDERDSKLKPDIRRIVDVLQIFGHTERIKKPPAHVTKAERHLILVAIELIELRRPVGVGTATVVPL
jgi:hypothetical protein